MEPDVMLVVSVVVVDGVERPEEGVEPAEHREMCTTTAVSLDIGHAPAPTGGHSREYQDLWSLLMQPVAEEYADIYWGLMTAPSSPSDIFSVYQLWKPWIQSLCPYTSPPDPPHVTLFYDSCHTEWYQDLFNETVEGRAWFISSKNIYMAPEGVAAAVEFTPEQANWYLMSDEVVPHVSLSLHLEHQAKELGGVVKRSLAAGDWQDTSVTNLSLFSGCILPIWVPQYPHKQQAQEGIRDTIKGLKATEECRDIFSFTYCGEQLRYTRLPQGFALSPGVQ
ncbi:uncharacterized protein LOC124859262 isoform X3 [Girardinichthys multiradiatus]|uniref:uncharacterized protein LOC124859262 isoform X3 n=1 Tax=Girardinichthys multiradiatus TaxID=208333 RepID=UPI001FAE6372|nr:uncharacterized protein LOC124859262 isoform X3 [Girardinichthys multiradiatus]